MTNRAVALNAQSPFFILFFPYFAILHKFPSALIQYSQILTKRIALLYTYVGFSSVLPICITESDLKMGRR